MRAWWLLIGVSGCFVDYESVDAACPNGFPGDGLLNPGTDAILTRMSCYRRYVGLSSMKVTKPVQDAVSAHGLYLEENGVLDQASPHYWNNWLPALFTETNTLPFFTGGDAYARLNHHDAYDPTADVALWEVLFFNSGADGVDDTMHSPYIRDVVFQPLLFGGGYAEFDTPNGPAGYMNILYTFPPSRRMDKPIVYPRDGQTDVPTEHAPIPAPENPLWVAAVTGYPVTITVGSFESNRTANPYALQLIEASIIGPEGQLELASVGPAIYPWGVMQATVGFAPVEPLQPFTTYQVEALLSWNARPRKQVSTTFTTGAAPEVGEPTGF